MRLPTLALASLAGIAGFAAGRQTQPTPPAASPAIDSRAPGTNRDMPPRTSGETRDMPARLSGATRDMPARASVVADSEQTIALATTRELTGDATAEPTSGEIGDDVGGEPGTDIGELIAAAQQHAEEQRHQRNVIAGRVEDSRSGEPIIGATIIASSPALVGAQAGVTDEHGDYEIAALPAGSYQLMFYYNESTDVRDGVIVSSFDVTRVIERFDLTRDTAVSVTGTEDMENTYIVDPE